MPPARVMTRDSTVAKMGRSMKKREITGCDALSRVFQCGTASRHGGASPSGDGNKELIISAVEYWCHASRANGSRSCGTWHSFRPRLVLHFGQQTLEVCVFPDAREIGIIGEAVLAITLSKRFFQESQCLNCCQLGP